MDQARRSVRKPVVFGLDTRVNDFISLVLSRLTRSSRSMAHSLTNSRNTLTLAVRISEVAELPSISISR
jgi:hypothetical protein